MKLKSCYINNFGKLHDFSYEFKDGLNTINELNGWGKSTFAAFIRAMFYGMDSGRSRKNLEDAERKKLKPWQGGAFGGNLVFELGEKAYRIERFFGDKDKEDSFVVYNLKTGLVSQEFTERIGEELFKLDREAYSRSTYIPQNAITTQTNDSIHAKLSNLIENDNDINNYESAMSKLDQCKKEYVKIGGRGKIEVSKNRISQLEQQLNICQSKTEAITGWKEKFEILMKDKENAKEKLQALKEQIGAASKYEALKERLLQYRYLSDSVLKLEQQYDPLSSFFKNKRPTQEELKEFDDMVEHILKTKGELSSFELTAEEKEKFEEYEHYFSNGKTDEETIRSCDELFSTYKQLGAELKAGHLTKEEEEKFQKLEEFFDKRRTDEGEADQYLNDIGYLNQVNSNISTLNVKLNLLENSPVAESNKKDESIVRGFVILMLAAAMFIGGIGLFFVLKPLGIFMVLLGAVLGIAGFLIRSKGKKNYEKKVREQSQKQSQIILDMENQLFHLKVEKEKIETELQTYLSFFSLNFSEDNYYLPLSVIKTNLLQYNNLEAKYSNVNLTHLKVRQTELLSRIDHFLQKYTQNVDIAFEEKELLWKTIKMQNYDYNDLLKKNNRYREIVQNSKNQILQLKEELTVYFAETDRDLRKNVTTLKSNYAEFLRLEGELKLAREAKTHFMLENNIEEMENSTPPAYSLMELQTAEKDLEAQLLELLQEETGIRRQIQTLSEEADRAVELTEEMEQLREDLEAYEYRYKILEKTANCMKQAKEDFSVHYMDSMNRGFQKYVQMLDQGNLGETNMDISLNVSISEGGSKKSLDYFSTGYKDLISICTRFALVDALFESEEPFLILDDSFVNLDENKLENALRMLEMASKKYQIIYFVCHDSRAANKR